MIRFLSQPTQDNIVRWLTANDLRKLVPLKSSRDYYRKMLLKVGRVPMTPATWDFDYLTPAEFCNFASMLDYAPW